MDEAFMDIDGHQKSLNSINTNNRLDAIFSNTIIINKTSSIHKDGDMKIVKR